MSKKVEFIANREEAASIVLEESLKRSPEDRIRWLYNQINLMNELSPQFNKETTVYSLKRRNG